MGGLLALAGLTACDAGGGTGPDSLRFGQNGSIEVQLEAPLRLGAGRLDQILRWGSSGEWSLHERISYRGVVGDENFENFARRGTNPSASASAYASVIAQVNEVVGLQLFIDELPQDLEPTCRPSQSRITLTIADDGRGRQARWIRCADGSLATLTQVGAGPDPPAARVVVAATFARDGTVGARFQSTYAGSVPFAALDRGQETASPLRAPAAFTSLADFTAFWSEHRPGTPPPAVDFTEDMVVAAIVGVRQEAGDSVEVRRVLQVDRGSLIEIYELIPGDFCAPAARPSIPFHVVVAPKTPEPISFADLRRELVPCG